MKKVLFTATVDSHILQFHLPFLKLFKDKGYEVHVATNGTEEIPYCDKKHVITFERSPYKLNNLKAIKQLKKICDEEKFDIIHTHTPMGGVVTRLAAKNARKKYGTRVIYTAHGFHFCKGGPLKNWILYYPIEWYLAKYMDTLITINNEDYELAKKKFSKRCNDINYVPGVGIDDEKFDIKVTEQEKEELRNELGIKDNDFVMIYPAEVSKRKRHLWLINTVAPMLKEHKDMYLLLPGEDSLNGQAHQLIKDYGLEKQLQLLGYRKDIPKLLRISNLSISSSDREGLPVNLMEAMYSQIPMVVTDCRGNRDLVTNGENGFVIEPRDSKAFNEAILKLKEDKKLYKKMSLANKELIKPYMLSEVMKDMEEIYLKKIKGTSNE